MASLFSFSCVSIDSRSAELAVLSWLGWEFGVNDEGSKDFGDWDSGETQVGWSFETSRILCRRGCVYWDISGVDVKLLQLSWQSLPLWLFSLLL